MDMLRVVELDGLLDRLRDALGEESLLFQKFQYAIKQKDDILVQQAMDSLKIYPQCTQRLVEETMLTWLFGGEQEQQEPTGINPGKQRFH